MKKIAVVGAGKIGYSIYSTLKNGFKVEIGDISHKKDVIQVDASNYNDLKKWLSEDFEVVLCALPYYLIKNVAKIASELNIAYFDLTEDRESTEYVKSLKSNNVLVPQCGLAPGAVSIIASDLIKLFDKVNSVDIRVGALPLLPNNSIQYYLTWSTNGLVNEYCNLCDCIYNGKRMEVLRLEGYEKISIDGQLYEAFNTSGGIGSLCESFENCVENLTYKTIRYVGHHKFMKFLLDDLRLSKNRELFIQLFDQVFPQTKNDVVVVMVKVIGYMNGQLLEKTYYKKIYGDNDQSAIQKATVAGICGVMRSWMTGEWGKTKGFVKQEEISFTNFTNNIWGDVYHA